MTVLVTGAAGFIGSTFVSTLLEGGVDVRGIDAFTGNYDSDEKRANVRALLDHRSFDLVEADLCRDPLAPLLDGIDTVVHLGGQPGVRTSWEGGFDDYVDNNITATRRLLDAVAASRTAPRVVFASTSSVYGNAAEYPVTERTIPHPISPYGVSKLAAEHLCHAYADRFGFPLVSLRVFTVFGPRQRPDMAFERLIRAALTGESFPMYGDGSQVREFTYVGDVVEAFALAANDASQAARTFNVAGGAIASLNEAVALIEEIVGARIRIDRRPKAAGDVDRTEADTSEIAAGLGWSPTVTIAEGLARQYEWTRSRMSGTSNG